MKKIRQNKKRNMMRIIMAIIIICIFILLISLSNKLSNKTKTNKLMLGENTIEYTNYEPNIPVISAGMIPVKKEGEDWIITTKEDANWYDYENGKPAYIMLNDGTYQSELLTNMNDKKLASDFVGAGPVSARGYRHNLYVDTTFCNKQ